jgi:hypothetical protein
VVGRPDLQQTGNPFVEQTQGSIPFTRSSDIQGFSEQCSKLAHGCFGMGRAIWSLPLRPIKIALTQPSMREERHRDETSEQSEIHIVEERVPLFVI